VKIPIKSFYRSKYPECEKYFLEAISKTKKLAITKEEYLWIIQNCEDLPEGLIWARTSIGAPSDKYLIYVKKPTEPKFSNTFLEEEFENILHELGYVKEKDYFKNHWISGYNLDFAFPSIKVAFEPGATYWHTPKNAEGEKVNPYGLSPEEVYFPPIPKDINKNKVLTSKGWVIGWLNEDFISQKEKVAKWVYSLVEKKKN